MGDLNEELARSINGFMRELNPGPAEEPEEEFDFDLSPTDRSRLSFIETLRALVAEFGGSTGVASKFKKLYQSDIPANTKARLLEKVFDGIAAHGEDIALDDEESIEAIEASLREIHYQEFLEQLPPDLRTKAKRHLNKTDQPTE